MLILECKLELKDQSKKSFKTMLEEAGLLETSEDKFYVQFPFDYPFEDCWKKEEVKFYDMENYQEVPNDNVMQWYGAEEEIEYLAYYLSEKFKDQTFLFYSGYYDSAGQWKTNTSTNLKDGWKVDPNGKPFKNNVYVWQGFIKENGDQIKVTIPDYRTGKTVFEKDYPKEDYIDEWLYLRDPEQKDHAQYYQDLKNLKDSIFSYNMDADYEMLGGTWDEENEQEEPIFD